jgi:hypothetical protein
MKRLGPAVVLAAIGAALVVTTAAADVVVTDRPYIQHDGTTNTVTASCSSDATTPGAGGEGGGERQANEPALAIKPDEPSFMVASANDYCTVELNLDAWQGIYTSSDGGASWTDSLLPGYPGDDSAEGQASPLRPNPNSGDPILDWDLDGHLYAGGISFNRTVPTGGALKTNGHVYVSTWQRDAGAPLGIDYLRTVIVAEGTPGNFPAAGLFGDKPHLKADDWASSPCKNNLYVSYTLFPGGGQDQIRFARSTDHGQSFSKPIRISKGVASAQTSEIAVAPDGTVYVFWRQFAFNPTIANEIAFVKSTDCGQSFGDPQTVHPLIPSNRDDGGSRDCGDGAFLCPSGFVFHRISSYPSVAVGNDGTLYVTYSEVVPAADNGDSYRPDGQSHVVVTQSTNEGDTWTTPVVADAQALGHQFWPDIAFDRLTGTLALVYYDSRSDPSYSVNRPPGNEANATSPCQVSDPNGIGTQPCDVLNTFVATSVDGTTWSPTKVSTIGHQPNFEMFSNRQIPFEGDYLWIEAEMGSVYGLWTDDRDVTPGADIREASQDGFDVLQCRADATAADTCANAGGLDQNIFGAGLSLATLAATTENAATAASAANGKEARGRKK